MDKPVVRVSPCSCQPGKAELEEHVSAETTPEKVRAALMQPVKVEEADAAQTGDRRSM